jgi:hypothetical protein
MTSSSIPAAIPAGAEPTLRDEERQPCEVWTRVMGYHRPVSSFNVGKQGEHAERQFFSESPARPAQ